MYALDNPTVCIAEITIDDLAAIELEKLLDDEEMI